MPQFVKVGQRMVNLDYVCRVDPNTDGTATIYVDNTSPQTVPAEDVPALMEALQPSKPSPAQLLEVSPFVAGGLGGGGLPAGMFCHEPPPTPPVAPVHETPVPPPVETPVPVAPEAPVADPEASETPADTPADAAADTPADETAKPKPRKTAAK